MSPRIAKKQSGAEEGRDSDQAINAYAKHALSQWLAENHTHRSAVAEKIGVSPSAITRLLNGVPPSGVGWRTARRIATLLGMSLSQFVDAADRHWNDRARGKGRFPLNEHPSWSDVAKTIEREFQVPRDDIDAAGKYAVELSAPLTADRVVKLIEGLRGQSIKRRETSRRARTRTD